MKTIKFRAWDTKHKKMWSADEMGRDQLTISPDGRGFVNVDGTSTKLSQYLTHFIPLQFTGLLDKKGREEYHKDIVRHTSGVLGVIEWDAKNARWYYAWQDGQKTYPVGIYDIIDEEIIGDIHSNPKLLEEKPCGKD